MSHQFDMDTIFEAAVACTPTLVVARHHGRARWAAPAVGCADARRAGPLSSSVALVHHVGGSRSVLSSGHFGMSQRWAPTVAWVQHGEPYDGGRRAPLLPARCCELSGD